jgi:hypothetical protein
VSAHHESSHCLVGLDVLKPAQRGRASGRSDRPFAIFEYVGFWPQSSDRPARRSQKEARYLAIVSRNSSEATDALSGVLPSPFRSPRPHR